MPKVVCSAIQRERVENWLDLDRRRPGRSGMIAWDS